MEKNRKDLKAYSIVILAFVALVLIQNIIELCVAGLPQPTEILEGMTEEIYKIAVIVILVISFIFLIPQVYIGVKGIMVANNPEIGGKAHIGWAFALAIISALALISSIFDLIKVFNVPNVLTVITTAIDVIVFICYYIIARKIANKE